MSRAFVKDADYLEELPERPISERPNDVKRLGADRTCPRSGQRSLRRRASISRSRGPCRRGANLRYWSARRAAARVVPAPTDHSEVRFGTSVTIVRDDGREQTFRIVGEDEADPAKGSISHVSPLARSMFGKRVGDVVRAGNGEAENIRIR
jgi:transcription elongation GreA/GreB family factor